MNYRKYWNTYREKCPVCKEVIDISEEDLAKLKSLWEKDYNGECMLCGNLEYQPLHITNKHILAFNKQKKIISEQISSIAISSIKKIYNDLDNAPTIKHSDDLDRFFNISYLFYDEKQQWFFHDPGEEFMKIKKRQQFFKKWTFKNKYNHDINPIWASKKWWFPCQKPNCYIRNDKECNHIWQ